MKAIECHNSTNNLYDGKSYDIHLQMVVLYALKYSHLVDVNFEIIECAAWAHDVIEDCRQNYSDVKKGLGVDVAEIVFALSAQKGKNRKERFNKDYYESIRNVSGARFVKLCDRLANVSYSLKNNPDKLKMYAREHARFKEELFSLDYIEMWNELDEMFLTHC